MEGTLRTGRMRLMASGANMKCWSAATSNPGHGKSDALMAGEVGYFTASIKKRGRHPGGRHHYRAERPAAEPLPGYKAAQPMVFCGIYTRGRQQIPQPARRP